MGDTLKIVFVLIAIALIVNVILAVFVVFSERRKPSSTWAWLLVLFFIPVFGFIIYMVFGRDSRREKLFADKDKFDTKVYFDYILSNERYMKKLMWQKKAI